MLSISLISADQLLNTTQMIGQFAIRIENTVSGETGSAIGNTVLFKEPLEITVFSMVKPVLRAIL